MTTDSERREVARRLRECKRTKDNLTATFDWAVYAALDPEWYKQENWIPYNTAVDRLADLIEPSEPKTTCVAEVKIEGDKLDEAVHRAMAEYAGVDRDVLLELAEEMGRSRGRCDFCIKRGECDWADETICLEKMMDDFARRIREACGEVES